MRRTFTAVLIALTVAITSDHAAEADSSGREFTNKARALFARLAGDWIHTAMPEGRKEADFRSVNVLFTLSRTGNRLLVEPDDTDRPPKSTRIHSIDAKRGLLRELIMTEEAHGLENKPVTHSQIEYTLFGKFETSGDISWLTYQLRPLHVWHMVDDNTIQDVPSESYRPDDWVNYRPPGRLIRRTYEPKNDTAQEAQGVLKEEKRILAALAGDWIEQEAKDAGTSFAGSKKILFTSSRFHRRLLGEYPDNSGTTYIWGVIPVRKNAFRGFFWWQLIETEDPARPSLIGMIGTVNPTEDAVLWKKNGQPAELWHFPDVDSVVRLTPDANDPFNVSRGKILSRWSRIKSDNRNLNSGRP